VEIVHSVSGHWKELATSIRQTNTTCGCRRRVQFRLTVLLTPPPPPS
jgi:hypothetical protein